MKNLNIIMISREADYFKDFTAALADKDYLHITCVTASEDVLEAVAGKGVDIVAAAEVVADGSGLDLIKQVVMKDAFINTALVSPLSAKDFHEVTEGLGVFMQISPSPGREDAEKFCGLLAKIY